MRLSCRPDDAGYERYIELMAGNELKFFLDGVEIKEAITADDEEGFVLVYVDDGNGKPLLNLARTEALTDRRAGAVRIEIHPRQ